MSSFQHLHARKKVHTDGAEDTPSTHSSGASLVPTTPDNKRRRSSRKSPFRSVEDGCAMSAVAFFLILGFILGYILLHHQHRKVIVHVIQNPWAHGSSIFRRRRAGFHHHFYSGSPRFVTVVMPSVVNVKGRNKRLNSIHESWGPYARAIFVVHNQTEFPQGSHLTFSEERNPSDPYSYPQTLLLPERIAVADGLPRLYYTIRAIHEKVDPDFVFFVNDHTFVIPEHLCRFLDGRSAEDDLYAGHALRSGKQEVFNSGAAGYLLSRGTMRKLMREWDRRAAPCWVDTNSPWLQGNPGLVTAQCLASLGIHATDTRSRNQWHRFHAFPLTRVVGGKVDEWYHKKHREMDTIAGFDASYNTLLSGEDCCSRGTISFHYVEYKECLALFAVRSALLQSPSLSDRELKSYMESVWPKDRKEIGFYSMGLPKSDDEWKPLLEVTRKISLPFTPDTDCMLM